MSVISSDARDYLLPSDNAFWRWEGGDTIVWSHGKTITFREELKAILEALTNMGAPPLGATLLLLAATRDNWREWDTESVTLQEVLDALPDSDHARSVLERVLHGLDRVHALPPDLRSTLASRVLLMEMVFEDQETELLSSSLTRQVITQLDRGLHDELVHQHWNFSSAQLLRDLMCLANGLGRLDETALRNRLETGLDALPSAVEDLDIGEQVRSLLTSLEDDDELQSLCKLAKQLLAAINLPRNISQPDELPVGGVSDISNRGSLDRLLLSELANDDLTLSVRLAMNEALYLRRETPPTSLPRRRAILLDAGLTTWGLPRVFSTAVGLALAAAGDHTDQATVFRPCGASLSDVDLTTRNGLVRHLSSLELDVAPSHAWPMFCEEAMGDQTAEPVLVTTEDAMQDPQFLRTIREQPLHHFLVAAVGREGDFHLYQRTPRGSKTLRQAKLDLSELMSTRSAAALRNDGWLHGLPNILRQPTFPLRFSHDAPPESHWMVQGHGLLCLTRSGRLLYWPELALADGVIRPSGKAMGAIEISHDVPGRSLLWADHIADENGRVWAISGASPHLLAIDLEKLECRAKPIPSAARSGNQIRSAVVENGAIVVIKGSHVDAYELETLRIQHSIMAPEDVTWRHGRFFCEEFRWLAVGFDGQAIQFTTVISSRQDRNSGVIDTLFDRDGVDGPMAVTRKGIFLRNLSDADERKPEGQPKSAHDGQGSVLPEAEPINAATQFHLPIKPPLIVAGISRDGRRVALCTPDRRLACEVDLRQGNVATCQAPRTPVLPPKAMLMNEQIRTRLLAVGTTPLGELVFRSRRGGFVALRLLDDVMQLTPTSADEAAWQAFEHVQLPSNVNLRLKVATFPCGAKVFLDNRGLLHFTNGPFGLPEFTLALHDRRVAGCTEDGKVWGGAYFTADQQTTPDAYAYQTLLQSFVNHLR